MSALLALLSIVLIVLVLLDGFEAIILPRRVTRPFRFARLYYQIMWRLWRWLAHCFAGKRRETFLSCFGPLSVLGLFATWVTGLIAGFALWHIAIASPMHGLGPDADFVDYLYFSGTTFFTLGYGDMTPTGTFGRFLSVVEAGLGFAFLACVIGYMPVLYQSFSRREVTISLLDARGGSPPSAAQILVRVTHAHHLQAITPFLAEWERWSAEVLESHLSYPVLSFYRSQHDNQSWLAALTAVLDACALLIAGTRDVDPYQAQLTFAMARHAVVDLALVFKLHAPKTVPDRMPAAKLEELQAFLRAAGLAMHEVSTYAATLKELRGAYEPFIAALSEFFLLALPPFLPDKAPVDNWQTSPWTRRTPGIGKLQQADEHFK